MKRLIAAGIVIVVLAVILSGCNGVVCNAEYAELLDRTAALADTTAVKAKAGEMTNEQMADSLVYSAAIWQKFKNAKDGIDDE